MNTGFPNPSPSSNITTQPRQIRFVQSNSDGAPPAKRRRINAACLTCRRRKTRCSGERPICKTCSDFGHDCLGYAEPSSQGPHGSDQYLTHSGGSNVSRSPLGKTDAQVLQKQQLQKHFMPKNVADKKDEQKSPTTSEMAFASNRQDFDRGSQTEGISPASSQSMSIRNKLPYFRYFGPTAIVPGFKQMVVQIRENQRTLGTQAKSGESPVSGIHDGATPHGASTPSRGHEAHNIPFYDPSDPRPNDPLITHLCEIFFTHLGCNYPFLQQKRFLRDLEDKKVDAILVDAVCALAARFSSNPLLTKPETDFASDDGHLKQEIAKSERGHPFAQRAMASIVDTFLYPSMAVVQACLLLAYSEFGANHDSGLWMYLGVSIRMAQDIGLQKLEGLRYEGRVGPTPKTVKAGQAGKAEERRRRNEAMLLIDTAADDPAQVEEQRAIERERIDTFWAIFFLDRVVSSGTGRPVTLRDQDIEISFPSPMELDNVGNWPAPFPHLIRIIHLYGRIADLLNNIQQVSEVTAETLKGLASMENDLTAIYQRLSPKLHFNPQNFKYYVEAGEGTNFILLHFWFHTLIVLLHQPTLLHSLGGGMQQLVPNSRELSMSSAKTIADILAFAEFIDAKSFIGNPFTSQPMYIAGCAFLMESASLAASNPESQEEPAGSLPFAQQEQQQHYGNQLATMIHDGSIGLVSNRLPFYAANASSPNSHRDQCKHNLLASQAMQNYQRCYQALKSLETYWAGTKYILTALDQKACGNMDPVLYTSEERDSAVELPRAKPSFTTPGWRRSAALAPLAVSLAITSSDSLPKLEQNKDEEDVLIPPKIDPSQAIGWSLTGTTDSPNPSLSFLYQAAPDEPDSSTRLHSSVMHREGNGEASTKSRGRSIPVHANAPRSASVMPTHYRQGVTPVSQPPYHSTVPPATTATTRMGRHSRTTSYPELSPSFANFPTSPRDVQSSDAEMLLGLHSTGYLASTPAMLRNPRVHMQPPFSQTFASPSTVATAATTTSAAVATATAYPYAPSQRPSGNINVEATVGDGTAEGFASMIPSLDPGFLMIESHDIDMSHLPDDMMGWLEYLPQDAMAFDGADGT